MSLTEELRLMAEKGRAKRPPAVQVIMDAAAAELADLRIVENSLGEGSVAPDFRLPNVHGEEVTLRELLSRGPVVMSFYRGGWCPYCNVELRYLQQYLPRFREFGATLVAISPQTPDHSLSTAEKNGLEFEVLSDVGSEVARRFGLVFTLPEGLRPLYRKMGHDIPAHNGTDTFELPLPATYVLDGDGIVARAFVDLDHTKRLDPEDILAVLEALRTTARAS